METSAKFSIESNLSARSVVRPDAEIVVSVKNVSKCYQLYDYPIDVLREMVTGTKRHRERWVVENVSFEIRRGEILGIIGSNGAGKSTLLKMIAGTLAPTRGSIDIQGRLSAILELGTGFHPEYSGRENVITGGMCLGMSREEVLRKLPWIISFSELADVIDQPFKTYSSGMQARLTFATAISIDPEILIIDEALAAGDSYFVAKSFKRIREICRSGATVLFVSHGTAQVSQLCHRAIWLDKGAILQEGDAETVTTAYDYDTHVRISDNLGMLIDVAAFQPQVDGPKVKENSGRSWIKSIGSAIENAVSGAKSKSDEPVLGPNLASKLFRRGPVVIDRVSFLEGARNLSYVFRTWGKMIVEVDYHCEGDIPEDCLGLAVAIEREIDMVLISQTSTVMPTGRDTDADVISSQSPPGRRGTIRMEMPEIQLLEGTYLFSVGLLPDAEAQNEFYEYHHRVYRIKVLPSKRVGPAGIFYPALTWKHDIVTDA